MLNFGPIERCARMLPQILATPWSLHQRFWQHSAVWLFGGLVPAASQSRLSHVMSYPARPARKLFRKQCLQRVFSLLLAMQLRACPLFNESERRCRRESVGLSGSRRATALGCGKNRSRSVRGCCKGVLDVTAEDRGPP